MVIPLLANQDLTPILLSAGMSVKANSSAINNMPENYRIGETKLLLHKNVQKKCWENKISERV